MPDGTGNRNSRARRRADRVWKLEDAKARFSEVVRLARSEGPQRVTLRGKEAVAVVAIEELERIASRASAKPEPSLIELLQGTEIYKLDIERSRQGPRKVKL